MGGNAEPDVGGAEGGERGHEGALPGVWKAEDADRDADRHGDGGPDLGGAGHAEAEAVVLDQGTDPGEVEDPMEQAIAAAGEAGRGGDEEDRGRHAGEEDAQEAEAAGDEAGGDPEAAHGGVGSFSRIRHGAGIVAGSRGEGWRSGCPMNRRPGKVEQGRVLVVAFQGPLDWARCVRRGDERFGWC